MQKFEDDIEIDLGMRIGEIEGGLTITISNRCENPNMIL